ncbi:S8 family serine peptidase [Cohnella sp.]|uniref:S8 family peptidase n=1 Tax=Cohnella sp. TaxID=1883426 RepID=UPI003566CD4E
MKIAVFDTGIAKLRSLPVAGGVSFVGKSTDYSDDNGHGTYVASVLAASGDLVQGVAPKASLYSIKVLDQNAEGSFSAVIEAIEWAVQNKMDIAVMSFGTDIYSAALADTLAYAEDNGLLLVASAGNGGMNQIDFAARFHSVIAVGAVDDQLVRAPFSNTGTELELMARGVQVPGLDRNGEVIRRGGTSSAASHTAGISALYMQSFPSLTNKEIRQLLQASALRLGGSQEYGYGLVQYQTAPSTSKSEVMLEDEENAWIEQQLPKQIKKEQDQLKRSKENKSKEKLKPDTANRELLERIDRKKTRELEQALTQLNEENVGRNIHNLAQEYSVSEDYLQAQLDNGLTLEETNKALGLVKSLKINFKDATEQVKKKIANNSNKVKSSIKSEIPEVDLTEANVFRASAVPPQPEEPQLDMLKIKLDEAPYRVSLETENVSTISGALSLTESDLTLPGRNGQSFTLTRSYDSGSSQLYDMDVQYNSYDYYEYYAAIDYRTDYTSITYNVSYSYHVIKNKYICSTGAFLLTEADYWEAYTTKSFSTESERAQFINNLPSYTESWDTGYCAQYDRKYLTKKYLSYSTSTTSSPAGSSTGTDYYGPYSTQTQAQSVANQYSVGQNYGSGTYSGGTYNEVVTGSSTASQYIGSSGYYTNKLVDAKDDKRFPIGKGWSWNIPYLTNNGTYVHLAGGGTYKVESGSLKGYPWKDLTFAADTTVTVNGVVSAYVLLFQGINSISMRKAMLFNYRMLMETLHSSSMRRSAPMERS